MGEVGRPDAQEPTQQRELHSKAPSSFQGRLCKETLRGWEVGALPCSAPPAGSWEPSAGLPTPTSLSFRPGNFWSPVSSGHTWPVVQGSLGALLQDQGLRVCHTPEGKPVLVCLTAASLPPDAQPEASWDRSSRWVEPTLSVVSSIATPRCLPPSQSPSISEGQCPAAHRISQVWLRLAIWHRLLRTLVSLPLSPPPLLLDIPTNTRSP